MLIVLHIYFLQTIFQVFPLDIPFHDDLLSTIFLNFRHQTFTHHFFNFCILLIFFLTFLISIPPFIFLIFLTFVPQLSQLSSLDWLNTLFPSSTRVAFDLMSLISHRRRPFGKSKAAASARSPNKIHKFLLCRVWWFPSEVFQVPKVVFLLSRPPVSPCVQRINNAGVLQPGASGSLPPSKGEVREGLKRHSKEHREIRRKETP